jgi:hypothetical protein
MTDESLSLDTLFLTSPMAWTEAQMTAGCLELRRRWSDFKAAEAAKALAPRKPKGQSHALTPEDEALLNKPLADITIEDLMGPEDT